MMINAEKFREIFGIYATELWAMTEREFLEWLNADTSQNLTKPNNNLQGWIPVTERLPEIHRSEYVPHPYLVQTNLLEDYYMISEPVLVTRINPSIKPEERIVVAQYEDDLDGRTYWETLDAELLVGVVAWQPLPEPYREEE